MEGKESSGRKSCKYASFVTPRESATDPRSAASAHRPKGPLPARMIHNVERSRPPAYSKELTTLLTTAYSRTTKALTLKALQHPHTLPPRADPSTNDAKFMGPLNKRREVNIRWKFFTEQHKKVHPPLQVVLEERTESGDVVHKTDSSSVLRAGIRPVGLQGSGVFEEVQALAASRPRRRSAHGKPYPDSHASQPDFRSHLPHRFLRRRFQFLLGRLPVMTYRRAMPGDSTSNAGKYEVSLAPNSRNYNQKWSLTVLPDADSTDLAWLHAAQDDQHRRKEASRKRREEARARAASSQNNSDTSTSVPPERTIPPKNKVNK
ncbi:hypothetical protein BKA93DRAFT_821156 [Sparassis latifolia]